MKKIIIVLLIATFILAGCSSTDTGNKETLKVGMELKYPPFETKATDGSPDGVSVMMAKELGKSLGVEIEIVDTPYASLIPALETGKIDLIISSMTINEERLKKVDFSDPYTTSQLFMLVYKDSKVQSYEDLNSPDIIIASKTGTIGALWAAANAPNAQIKNIDEEASAVLEVSQGKADVFIYDPLSIIRHQENYPDTTRVIYEPLPNTQGWGIVVQKGNTELLNQINDFLETAKTDGTFDKIRDTYLKDKIEEFKKYDLEFFF